MRQKRKKGSARPFTKGRQTSSADLQAVRAALTNVPKGRDLLIEHLHTLNDTYGHLSAGHIAALAQVLGLAQIDVYETASFYAHFHIVAEGHQPPPRLTLRICDGPACKMAGAKALLNAALDAFGDQIKVVVAPCQGACDTPPSAILGKKRISSAHMDTLRAHIDTHLTDVAAQAPIDTPSPVVADGLKGNLAKAGLRGMGGAGFSVAKKWAFFDHAAAPRVLVVNADEGEPGTFKDRYLLEKHPQEVLTGMMLSAQVLEVEDVFFYLRDEYAHLHAALAPALETLSTDQMRVHLRRGAGAYICGEETALINSLEGKRGQPRNRPPYPAQAGYKQRPTITQNVETLYWIADIHQRGAEAYITEGRPRFYSVSGRVRNPGVYRAPSTSSVADLIDMAGGLTDGHTLKAFLPGGASGGIFPAHFADKAMDFGVFEEFGGFVGSGALTVLSDQDDLWQVARGLMAFFTDESCGKCTPCRIGTEKMLGLIDTPYAQTDLIHDLSQTMREASICGLGQAAPNAVLNLLDHFEEDER